MNHPAWVGGMEESGGGEKKRGEDRGMDRENKEVDAADRSKQLATT